MKTNLACILLNYNDADTSLRLLEKIKNYKSFDKIIIVDNNSSDLSALRLEEYIKDKENIVLIKADENLGYGAGNNLGIREAYLVYNIEYALVVNPDTHFEDRQIDKMLSYFSKDKKLACLGMLMLVPEDLKNFNYPKVSKKEYYKLINDLKNPPAFKLNSWLFDLINFLPLSRRIFHKFVAYKKEFYKSNKTNIKEVDAIAGSLLMLDLAKFIEVGEYDENVFLYEEELIIGAKLKALDYKTKILLDEFYIHEHSKSINKSFKSALAKQKLRENSTLYYYKNYLSINKLKECISKLIFLIVRLEIVLYSLLGKKNE